MKKPNLALLICLLTPFSWANANSLPAQPHISVSGQAKLEVKPDTVSIKFQSVAVENDSDNAKQVVDKQVDNILAALQEGGFSQASLKRADIQIRPEFEYIEKQRTQIGVKAIRNLSYQLDDVTKVNQFLQVLVKSDISNIGQINYALKDPKKWQKKVRNLAVQDSINKAKGLADNYQATLGDIFSINYRASSARPVLMRAMESDQLPSSYQNNQITITDSVDAVFLLEP